MPDTDDRREAVHILQRMTGVGRPDRLYDFCDPEADCEDAAQKCGLSAEAKAEWFGPLLAIYAHVAAGMAAHREEIARLFSALDSTAMSLGHLFMLHRRAAAHREPAGAGQEDGPLLALLANVPADDDDGGAAGRPANVAELAEALAALEAPDATRWQLVDAYLRRGEYGERTAFLLDKAEALYREKKHLAAPLVRRCVDELKAGQGLVFGKGLAISDMARTTVYPCLFGYATIELRDLQPYAQRTGAEPPAPLMYYGVLVNALTAARNDHEQDSARLLRAFKALSDKTRLQILAALRTAPMNGRDIARLTGLTAATVSHHMNELFNIDLVRLEKQGTSVLYILRDDTVRGLMEQMGKTLL